MNTLMTAQKYDLTMQRIEEIIASATVAGGFENLPESEVKRFGNLVAFADKYETTTRQPYTFSARKHTFTVQEEALMA
ncbi:hypothetical protein FACS189467_3400 [Bacteroidia bacterium]|nr:hypothetical protein FACS189467_3400 [Bacteroidia bacterium]